LDDVGSTTNVGLSDLPGPQGTYFARCRTFRGLQPWAKLVPAAQQLHAYMQGSRRFILQRRRRDAPIPLPVAALS
jgi:hypothetical protein